MINQIPTPTNAPTPMNAPFTSTATSTKTSTTTSSMSPKMPGEKKIFGISKRSFFTVVGLTSFLVLTIAGVYIALLQRFKPEETVAPTAPQSRPQAAQEVKKTCTLSFTVGTSPSPSASVKPSPSVVPVSYDCTKLAYRNNAANVPGKYVLEQEAKVFKPGAVVVFKMEVPRAAKDNTVISLRDQLDDNFTFMDSNCGANAYDATTRNLTCTSPNRITGGTFTAIFRARINDKLADDVTIRNNARIFVPSLSTTGDKDPVNNCAVTITTTVITQNACGQACGTTKETQCEDGLTCSASGKCVLNACATDPSKCKADLCSLKPVACGFECGGSNGSCDTGMTCASNKCVLDTCAADPSKCNADMCSVKVVTTPTPQCGETCSTTGANTCPTNHSCDASTAKCVYNTCLQSGVTCDAVKCVVIPSTPTPTPPAPVGCNAVCAANADCSDPRHICWQGSCRLDTNPNSATCTNPPTGTPTNPPVVTTTTQVAEQPVLPDELPQTGILDDGLRVLGAGFAAFGLGALLLLLL